MPSLVLASSTVLRAASSEAFTAVALVETGTAMVAVIFTLAACMSMVTNDLSTPAALAIFCCKPDDPGWYSASVTDPLAVSTRTTAPADGGGAGGGGEGGGGLGGGVGGGEGGGGEGGGEGRGGGGLGEAGGEKGGEGGEGGGSTVQYFHAVCDFHCEEMDSAQP